MSDNKYQPPVNMPENVPLKPISPGSTVIQFLHNNGMWIGVNAELVGLCQKDETHVSLAVQKGEEVIHLLTFNDVKIVPIIEKTVVVP